GEVREGRAGRGGRPRWGGVAIRLGGRARPRHRPVQSPRREGRRETELRKRLINPPSETSDPGKWRRSQDPPVDWVTTWRPRNKRSSRSARPSCSSESRRTSTG